jgi:glutamate carboxypeptidase
VAGGERTNVIPDLARAMVDVRVPTASDARRIDERLRSLSVTTPGTSLEVRGAVARPPLERTPANVALYELARSCARDLGRELGEGAAGGGSDGNFTGALGVSTLDGLGPDGDGAHALHEHILIEELPWRAALLARLLSRLPDWQTR